MLLLLAAAAAAALAMTARESHQIDKECGSVCIKTAAASRARCINTCRETLRKRLERGLPLQKRQRGAKNGGLAKATATASKKTMASKFVPAPPKRVHAAAGATRVRPKQHRVPPGLERMRARRAKHRK